MCAMSEYIGNREEKCKTLKKNKPKEILDLKNTVSHRFCSAPSTQQLGQRTFYLND